VAEREEHGRGKGLPKADWDSGDVHFSPLQPGDPWEWRTLTHNLSSTNLLVDAKFGGENSQGAVEWFVLGNYILIIGGTIVGASGTILTRLMSSALGRPLRKIIFAGIAVCRACAPHAPGPSQIPQAPPLPHHHHSHIHI